MSAISDCRNCVKVTPFPANPPRRVCFLPVPGTHRASQGRGGRDPGASPGAWVGVGGPRRSCSSRSSESQLDPGRAGRSPNPWLVEFLSPRGAGRLSSALTPRFQSLGEGWAEASGKPARHLTPPGLFCSCPGFLLT